MFTSVSDLGCISCSPVARGDFPNSAQPNHYSALPLSLSSRFAVVQRDPTVALSRETCSLQFLLEPRFRLKVSDWTHTMPAFTIWLHAWPQHLNDAFGRIIYNLAHTHRHLMEWHSHTFMQTQQRHSNEVIQRAAVPHMAFSTVAHCCPLLALSGTALSNVYIW